MIPRSRSNPSNRVKARAFGVYPCSDGWLGVIIQTPMQFRAFCEMIGVPDIADDPRFVVGGDRLRHAAELEATFVPRLLERTAKEWFEQAIRRRLPFAIVPDMATLLATPTHRFRDASNLLALRIFHMIGLESGPEMAHNYAIQVSWTGFLRIMSRTEYLLKLSPELFESSILLPATAMRRNIPTSQLRRL